MSVEIDFFDKEFQNCPFDGYHKLHEEAPVYQDPMTGIFHVSRYEDVRHVLANHELFSGRIRGNELDESNPRQQAVNKKFEEGGWLPAATLIGRDEPNHKQMRAIFNEAFRPSRVKSLEGFVESTARELMNDILASGECDWVRSMAIPLPLTVIVHQMGAEKKDLWRIKAWTDAFFHRISMMLDENREMAMIEQEIEAQHYFQPIFERLRREPNDTVLSDLVNRVIPEWGRTLNDNELHAEMMADTFVGGSETTTNALSAGARILAEQPDTW